ncbi:MAG: hypothetical protein CM15mP58_11360 [Burkholderiaceae bacterium]|nr:MAG: hypothetical protein CM15mP58_11360 [Burkholderiaceae bacterium]
MKNAMQCGTAGLTASMAVLKLRDFGLTPDSGKSRLQEPQVESAHLNSFIKKLGFHVLEHFE